MDNIVIMDEISECGDGCVGTTMVVSIFLLLIGYRHIDDNDELVNEVEMKVNTLSFVAINVYY